MPKHFVLTRFGLGRYGTGWLDPMIDLLEAVTVSSLKTQTDQNFHYLLVTDGNIPSLPKLKKVFAGLPNFHIVEIDSTAIDMIHVGNHDWLYRCCEDYILGHGLITDPSEYILTSALDGDDGWHRDFVATTNALAELQIPELVAQEAGRGKTLSHSAGLVITFPNGLTWFPYDNILIPRVKPFTSLSITVLARFSSGVSAWSSRHIVWPEFAKIVAFRTEVIETNHPMWIYVRHNRSILSWRTDQADPATTVSADLAHEFGVDLDLIERWRPTQDARPGDPPGGHAGNPIADQFSRIFEMTALNRQIDALSKRLADATPADLQELSALSDLLDAQKTARAKLIEIFRQEGLRD